MNLKPNKWYRTRNGRKAFIGFRMPDVPGANPWVGYIEEGRHALYWRDDGTRVGIEGPFDIVEELT